jgi:hypothetical protein
LADHQEREALIETNARLEQQLAALLESGPITGGANGVNHAVDGVPDDSIPKPKDPFQIGLQKALGLEEDTFLYKSILVSPAPTLFSLLTGA